MRRLGQLALLIAAVFVAGALPATAQSGPKATGGVNFVTAIGAEAHASFVAIGDELDAKGQVQVKNHGGVTFHGEVDCYYQAGNLARFNGPITRFSGENLPGNTQGTDYFEITVVDAGEPGRAGDLISVQRFPNRTGQVDPGSCSLGRDALQPVMSGNLQVHQ